ncbi:zeta-sarcoglycan-like isoform X2 [Amphiura filiformis]
MGGGQAGGYTSFTPGAGPSSASSAIRSRQPSVVYKVGIYGWRKRCVYLLILILMAIVIVNISLTIWILRVMNFTLSGMGKLRITSDGIKVDGEAEFLKSIYTAEIRSRRNRALQLQSSQNITLNARSNGLGNVTSRFVVGNRNLVSHNERFIVYDTRDNMLFYADQNEVKIGTEKLTFTGREGAVFDSAIQTPSIIAESGQSLSIESLTGKLNIEAPEGIQLRGGAGQITASCLTGLNFQSTQGKILLDSPRIELKNLPTGSAGTSNSQGVFELCTCENGRLFLAPPESGCQATVDLCT